MLWLYDLPTSAMVTLFSVIFVGFTWIGAIFVRPFLRLLLRAQPGLNDIVGYVLSSHCVFFGLLLGLLAVGTYQNMSDIEKVIVREAGLLRAFYRSMQNYPEPLRSETLPLIKEYVRYVIEESWPLQQRGIVGEGGVPRMNAVQERLFSFEPTTKGQEILHDKTVEQFNQMAEVRRQRIQSANTGISPIMWYVVGIGSLITIVMVWLFDCRLSTQFILGGALAFFLGTVVSLIVAMDRPFNGDVSIGPDAYRAIYVRMKD
jgi:Protein of unknown function (DUF4239)